MRSLLLTVAVLLLAVSASTYAKDDDDKLDARVETLELENAQQQEQIDQNDANIAWLGSELAAETEARENEDAFLQEQIGDEITARQNEDGFLQEQIEQNDADIDLLFDADAQQQNQIDDNEQRIAEVQSAMRGTWVVIDSDDPPKEVGIVTWAWGGSADMLIEIDGYLLATSAFRDSLQNESLYYDQPGCTGQAYAYAQDYGSLYNQAVLGFGGSPGSVAVYVASGPPSTLTVLSYRSSTGGCGTYNNTRVLQPVTELPDFNIYEVYPPPYSMVKQ